MLASLYHYLGASSIRKKEVFYLTTHSTHFIYGYIVDRHTCMVKDHKDNERGKPLPPLNGLLQPKKQQGIFYMHFPIYRTVQTMDVGIPVVGQW